MSADEDDFEPVCGEDFCDRCGCCMACFFCTPEYCNCFRSGSGDEGE